MYRPPPEGFNGNRIIAPAVRYRPGEALRWLEGVSEGSLDRAREKAGHISERQGSIGTKIKDAAGVLIDLSRSAYAELTKRRADASEFAFLDSEFVITRPGAKQTLPYSSVKKFTKDKDKVVITLSHGSITVRPYAYIVAGKVRVPVGWDRNGSEVPYEVLFEEWAARCQLPLDVS
jgi:hypothetical protein